MRIWPSAFKLDPLQNNENLLVRHLMQKI